MPDSQRRTGGTLLSASSEREDDSHDEMWPEPDNSSVRSIAMSPVHVRQARRASEICLFTSCICKLDQLSPL